MIQDIAPHIYQNKYELKEPKKTDFVLCYDGRTALAGRTEGGILTFPTFEEMEACNEKKELYENYRYLFTIDGKGFYLGSNLNFDALEDYAWENTWIFREANPKHIGFAGITGWQLHNWYRSRRFCGRCGKPMVHDEKERMMKCPECGLMEFPKICPAVIVGVTHGNRLLMSKYAGREYTKYALLAGFTEIGETPEETVVREVFEEVGVRVKNIRYYKCQPWSFSDTLLMGFFCDLDGSEDITLDKEELALAEWFEREDIPVKAEDCSLTNEMIMAFKNGEV